MDDRAWNLVVVDGIDPSVRFAKEVHILPDRGFRSSGRQRSLRPALVQPRAEEALKTGASAAVDGDEQVTRFAASVKLAVPGDPFFQLRCVFFHG